MPSQRDFHDYLRNQKPTRDTFLVNSKDVDEKLASAAKVVKATYLYPYQMHGSIGSSCAVADVQGDKATIWSATQAVYPLKSSAAMVLGLPPENVHVDFQNGRGLLRHQRRRYRVVRRGAAVAGRRQTGARAADAQGRDGVGELRLRLRDRRARRRSMRDGTIIAWDHESWSPTLGGRPGATNPGNVVTGIARRLSSRRRSRRERPRRIRPASPTTATPCRPTSPAASADDVAGRERWRASAS